MQDFLTLEKETAPTPQLVCAGPLSSGTGAPACHYLTLQNGYVQLVEAVLPGRFVAHRSGRFRVERRTSEVRRAGGGSRIASEGRFILRWRFGLPPQFS